MRTLDDKLISCLQSRNQRFKDAVIAVFREPTDTAVSQLGAFNERDWRRGFSWLDASGLTLYLIERITTSGERDAVPMTVFARLQQNLVDNQTRTDALFTETVTINHGFRQANIIYANLKGITLYPESVPEPTLRCQLDLDFLIDAAQGSAAQEVLEGMGYVLDAISGDTWEFKAGGTEVAALKDLYKPKPQRSVELHLLHQDKKLCLIEKGLFERIQLRSFYGELLPVLSPADLFLNQAHHLFKHVCSAFTRISWLLEYRRHVIKRHDDTPFWETVQLHSSNCNEVALAIGVVTLITSEIFGDFAPPILRRSTVDQLPVPVQLWIKTYCHRAMLADFPGTKLYLLLQRELDSARGNENPQLRKHLLPLRSPSMISHGQIGEKLVPKLNRYRVQFRFILFRLRFHIVEGIRYALELPRWHWRMIGSSN